MYSLGQKLDYYALAKLRVKLLIFNKSSTNRFDMATLRSTDLEYSLVKSNSVGFIPPGGGLGVRQRTPQPSYAGLGSRSNYLDQRC